MDIIKQIVEEFLHPKPYLICICGDFKPGEKDKARCFTRCGSCNGWMSDERIVEGSDANGPARHTLYMTAPADKGGSF